MADGRRNNKGQKGKANKGGSKGYAMLEMVKKNLNKYQQKWWDYLGIMMKNDDKELKKFAMAEYNKLQIKLLPTILGGDNDNPLSIHFDETFNTTSKTKRNNKE